MSQELYDTILRLRKEKPVVVSMVDLAASGGYYISSAADRIFAEPGTLTGSIGVIINTFNVQELLNQKLGIKANVIKSGKYKDLASPYRAISPDERDLLQNIINSTYQQFVNAIIEGRVKRTDKYNVKRTDLTIATLKKYADGRIFTGEQAVTYGFADQLGGLYDSHEAITIMAKSKFKGLRGEIPLVQYNMPSGLGGMLFGITESVFPKKDIASSLVPLSTKFPRQPLFMWE
ncbi:MAG TPA: signal peptide peptidase SppA [Cyanobacteria bacterium UBA9579]|nr:signal peptide peptidase SppA [Cyanobacteria bacterium UBA9579]